METLMLAPLLNRVVVEIAKEDEVKTSSGLILPPSEKKRYLTGIVKAIGYGKYSTDGSLIPMHVKPGMKVSFDKGAGREYGESTKLIEYRIMFEDEIWGIEA